MRLAAWRMDPGALLRPEDAGSDLISLLRQAHSRGCAVRVMLSHHLRHDNRAMAKALSQAGIECVGDRHFPWVGSSHQKLAVVRLSGELRAFCGGIDPAPDRWDEPTHSCRPERQVELFPGGWHDVHCAVTGPAAADLDLTFRERWESSKRGAPIPVLKPPAGYSAGSQHVQVLRTYAASPSYPFARRGELSAAEACLRAISLARRLIYIEDQYFVSYRMAEALVQALRQQPDLRVVLLVPQEAAPLPRPFQHHQHLLLSRLGEAAGERFAAYHLVNPVDPERRQVYVHSKMMVVDDAWAEIGSMNFNRRSMTHDMELAAAVVDEETENGAGKVPHRLRRTLCAEHLGLDTGDARLIDPVETFDLWRERSKDPRVRAKAHHPRPERRPWGWSLLDPDGRAR